MSELLRFLHLPKTGGTTLLRAFEASLGDQCVFLRKAPLPRSWRRLRRRGRSYRRPDNKKGVIVLVDEIKDRESFRAVTQDTLAVLGHGRYKLLSWLIPPERTFVFFRDPVERVVSRYYHLRRSEKNRAEVGELSLLEWARLERTVNFRSKVIDGRNWQSQMTTGLDLDKAFVGVTEHFDESVKRLNERWPHLRLQPREHNVNPDKTLGARYDLDPSVRAEIEKLNADDMALYERVRKLYE
jgi:hypothetical protein